MTSEEIQKQLAEYQNMKLNYDRLEEESEELTETRKKILDLIPVPVIVAYLMKKKKIKRMWMAI